MAPLHHAVLVEWLADALRRSECVLAVEEQGVSDLGRLAVHQVGMPCDLARLLEVADRHGLPVVEDAACAIGSEILWDGSWERIGRPHGTIACFSFHPRKVISTGDGGMITTTDPDLDATFRLLRQHGMSVNARDRHGSNTVIFVDGRVLAKKIDILTDATTK